MIIIIPNYFLIDSLIIAVTMGALGKGTVILNTVCMLENGYRTR